MAEQFSWARLSTLLGMPLQTGVLSSSACPSFLTARAESSRKSVLAWTRRGVVSVPVLCSTLKLVGVFPQKARYASLTNRQAISCVLKPTLMSLVEPGHFVDARNGIMKKFLVSE